MKLALIFVTLFMCTTLSYGSTFSIGGGKTAEFTEVTQDDNGHYLCPVCRSLMFKYDKYGKTVYECTKHHVSFDFAAEAKAKDEAEYAKIRKGFKHK